MVDGPADRQNIELTIARDAANISPQRFGFPDELGAFLGAEDAMSVIEDVGSGHFVIASPFGDSFRNVRHVAVCRPPRRALRL